LFGHVEFMTSATEGTRVAVPARNVGAGLAFIQSVRMHWDEAGAAVTPTTYFGTPSKRVAPPGEEVWARFSFGPEAASRIEGIATIGRFWVAIDYVDDSGGQAQTTRLDVIRTDAQKPWRVARVSLLNEGEVEPYVTSGDV